MKDPYSVLGVPTTATEDEIKKAYRDLARKYHPDNYHDNPLADLAQEKMKEINEAYDALTKGKNTGYSGSAGSSGGSNGYSGTGGYSSDPAFQRIRQAINSGNFDLAEQLLNSSSNRSAEWHFLMGSLRYRMGWVDEALRFYTTAVNMDPTNPEYRQAYAYASNTSPAYRTGGYPSNQTQCDFCDICSAMMCANLLCRC